MKNKIYISTRVFSPLLKIFAFILVIKASFLVSFAFLGENLGLDLYKKIDSGYNSLEKTQYSYELKGGIEGGTITEKVNRILKNKGLDHCEVKNITEDDIEKISNGDVSILSERLNGKCSTIGELSDITENIKVLQSETIKRAKEKSKQIYNISKIGLYSDGSVKNSPFDIIYDIKQIDQIVFTQKVEYKGGKNIGNNELSNYLKGKLDKYESDANKKLAKELTDLNEATNELINGKNNNLPPDIVNSNNTLPPDLQNNNGNNNNLGDSTQYSCPSAEESGLSESEYNNILSSNNGSSNGSNNLSNNTTNTIDSNGIINKNYKPYNPGKFGYSTGNGSYNGVNDNDFWGGNGGCDTFFCITVEFITHNSGILGDSETTMSIQALLERSNGHLKKFANSSLIQSKMTTNNFELGLRDLDLSEIFSFGMIISKKTPPILDLQGFNDEAGKEKSKEDSDPLSKKNLLKARFDAIGMNFKRENDLSIYLNRIGDEKSVDKSSELNLKNATQKYYGSKEFKKSLENLDLHLENVINSNSNASDTDQLYQEFLELERFASEIQAYSNDLYEIVGKMVEIPIHP